MAWTIDTYHLLLQRVSRQIHQRHDQLRLRPAASSHPQLLEFPNDITQRPAISTSTTLVIPSTFTSDFQRFRRLSCKHHRIQRCHNHTHRRLLQSPKRRQNVQEPREPVEVHVIQAERSTAHSKNGAHWRARDGILQRKARISMEAKSGSDAMMLGKAGSCATV
ncbi:uncharacterized protein ARMOST_15231 [Armillaria ostoyae]|uniref:Uncharacterized protein n=1 Tax=Armillaria ostoyae TaxID=47428 RepID=A0A284RSV1_ARMOS|nr:uncharacterized protein ARMOST_15231 [Armillaria ostoyae]